MSLRGLFRVPKRYVLIVREIRKIILNYTLICRPISSKSTQDFLAFVRWVIFHAFVNVCYFFLKLDLKKKKSIFRKTIRVSKGWDPDQDQHSVGPF